MLRTALIASLALAQMVPPLAAPPPFKFDRAPEEAALRWIEADAHPLSGPAPSRAELRPLVLKLSGARVIGLGEATHGDHDDQLFKATLIRELVRTGAIDALAMELNRTNAARLDAFVHGGTGSPAPLMRYEDGFYKAWSDREFAGLLEWLRDWNRTAARPVRIFGVDDQDVGKDAAFALAFVARRDPALADQLRRPLETVVRPNSADDPRGWYRKLFDTDGVKSGLAGTRALADSFVIHASAWQSDPEYIAAHQAAEAGWQNFKIREFSYDGAGDHDRPVGYYSRRDRFMAANLLALARPGERVAFWAHNAHVRRAVAPNEKGTSTTGVELYRQLGAAYRCVGFTWSTGSIATVVGKSGETNSGFAETNVALPDNRPGEIGSVFGRSRYNAWWLDMTRHPHTPIMTQWLKTPYYFGEAGWGVDPSKWQNISAERGDEADMDQIFDVLVWFRTIEPAQRL